MQQNEELWEEENQQAQTPAAQGQDLRGVGIMPGGMDSDIAMGDELAGIGEEPVEGEGEMGAEMEPGAEPQPSVEIPPPA